MMLHERCMAEGSGPGGRATALATSGDAFGRIVEFSGLRFNRDDGGERLSARSSGPLPVGATVTLGFGEPGRQAAFGTVEACDGEDRRWRMRVRIDRAVAG